MILRFVQWPPVGTVGISLTDEKNDVSTTFIESTYSSFALTILNKRYYLWKLKYCNCWCWKKIYTSLCCRLLEMIISIAECKTVVCGYGVYIWVRLVLIRLSQGEKYSLFDQGETFDCWNRFKLVTHPSCIDNSPVICYYLWLLWDSFVFWFVVYVLSSVSLVIVVVFMDGGQCSCSK